MEVVEAVGVQDVVVESQGISDSASGNEVFRVPTATMNEMLPVEGHQFEFAITDDNYNDTKKDDIPPRRENQYELYLQSVMGLQAVDCNNQLQTSPFVINKTSLTIPSSSVNQLESEFEGLSVRRSRSLKTYTTPPSTPNRKKEVRFADALGLDLESVRHIINSNEPPVVPESATRHLHVAESVPPEVQRQKSRQRLLHACFPQPGLSPNFASRVAERRVALHSFRTDFDILSGTICVANIAYEKHVTVRYTFDNWSTYTDVAAEYVNGSNTGNTDLFRFSIQLPEMCGFQSSFIEFSILFAAGGLDEVYWDSNFGANYRVDCYFT